MRSGDSGRDIGRFPETVREGMAASGAGATCVPVQLDGEAWEAAFFFQVGGPECKEDRRALRSAKGRPLPVGLESDLVETAHGAVVVLRPEIHTRAEDPLACEVLLTPGRGGMHFETLEHLTRQERLSWFLGDGKGWVIHAQQHPLEAAHREEFASLLRDAARHDALVRVTGTYDADAAVAEVAGRYQVRSRGS